MAHEFKAKKGLAVQENTLIREDIGFRQGDGASTSNKSCFAQGDNCTASGNNGCFAQGDNCTASGDNGCFAQGSNSTASGDSSWAIGVSANATATEAFQFGAGTNSEANSLQIGSGPRIVSGGAPASSQNGDVWINSNITYIRSNSIDVPIGTSQTLAIRSITTATTLADTDGLILAGGTSDYTISLPAANTVTNKVFYIKKTSTESYTLTIDGSGSETIDGELTVELVSQYDTLTLISDGSNWHII
ncbi:MAG: hypothetical protein ACOC56_03495 [Atribacterota bacterium]